MTLITPTTASSGRSATLLAPLPVGIEEEFLLIDPRSGDTVPLAQEVVDILPERVAELGRVGLRPSVLELITPVCADLTDLRYHLALGRHAAAQAAMVVGAWLVATGMTPAQDVVRELSAEPRYLEMEALYGEVTRDAAVCGGYLHVRVPDRETAVQVCNHLRPWLPILHALTANSPVHAGIDTGHASWRSVQLGHWPNHGPTPYFHNADGYDRAVAALTEAGVIIDERMACWYARPSARYPAVEVSTGDVCSTVEEAVLSAALTRALVATAIDHVAAGAQAPRPRDYILAAAHWRAARDGLEGRLVDVFTGSHRPAWTIVGDLVGFVDAALRRHHDHAAVTEWLEMLRHCGTAAARQRTVFRRTGSSLAVLEYLTGQTTATWRASG